MRLFGLSRTALTRTLEPMFLAGTRRGRSRHVETAGTWTTRTSHPTPRARSPDTRGARHRGRCALRRVDEIGTVPRMRRTGGGTQANFADFLSDLGVAAESLTAETSRSVDRCVELVSTMIDPFGERVIPGGAKVEMPSWIGRRQRPRIELAVGAALRASLATWQSATVSKCARAASGDVSLQKCVPERAASSPWRTRHSRPRSKESWWPRSAESSPASPTSCIQVRS